MEETLKLILSRLDSLDNGQKAIWGTLGTIDNRLGTVENRLGTVDNRLETIDDRLETIDDRLGTIDDRLGTVENNQTRLEIRMENEVIDKIRALFDDRDVQNARFDELEKKLDAISIDLSFLVTRVIRLEQVAK